MINLKYFILSDTSSFGMISPLKNPQICDAFRDLVPFVEFKKCEKHPWRSVNYSEFAG